MNTRAATPDWLRALAPAAGADAAVLAGGLPDRRAEAWKYIRLDALARDGFGVLGQPPVLQGPAAAPAGGVRLVFAGGFFLPEASALGALPAGLTVTPLSVADAAGAVPTSGHEFFRALTRTATRGGVHLHVAPGARLEAPVEVVHLGAGPGVLGAPVLRLSTGAGAALRLVERRVGFSAQAAELAVPMLRADLADGAELDHLLLLDAAGGHHVQGTQVNVQAHAQYRAWVLAGGGALARADLDVNLNGAGAGCELAVLYTAAGREQTDVHLNLEHAAANTRSRVLARGVAGGAGRAVFNGRVHVHPGADGTDARMSTGNLLLSAQAEVNAKPELEIYADDVQCAHGATVGQIDDAQLHYLRSRGVEEGAARALLIGAFARAVLGGLDEAFDAAQAQAVLDARLVRLADGEGA